MEKRREGTLAITLLLFIKGVLVCGGVEVKPSVNPVAVGQTLTLSLSPSSTLKTGSWAVGESLVLTWLGEQQVVSPSYAGRASVDIPTGAFTLSSVTAADSGVYVVQSTDPELRAEAAITVLDSVGNVTLSATQTGLKEFLSSAVISCSASSGSSLSFLWMNGSSEVTAGARVQLSDGNSTLTIVNMTRYDRGPFRCLVSNPVSEATSDPVDFSLVYGPDNMALMVNGQNSTSFPVGSNLSVLCSVQSSPPARLDWSFNGDPLNVTGPLLQLVHATQSQSGPYSCLAFNNHTNLFSNITANIMIAKSSGSEPHVGNVFLLSLMILMGFFSALPGMF